ARMATPTRAIPVCEITKWTADEWLGNVRELQNVSERALILSNDLLTIDTDCQTTKPTASEQLDATVTSELVSLEEAERRHNERILKQTNWLIEGTRGAARILGGHPTTQRSSLQKLRSKPHEAH